MRNIDVTVAAIVERNGRYLMVEERVGGRRVLNQPAGHLEPGESLLAAAARECHEETGLSFEPRHVLGVYLWRSESGARSFLRVALVGAAAGPQNAKPLDAAVIAAHWLGYAEILSRAADLRSPMVLRCIEDHRAGARYPLSCITSLLPTDLARDAPLTSRRAG